MITVGEAEEGADASAEQNMEGTVEGGKKG